jgi:acyl-CoA thioesterase-2
VADVNRKDANVEPSVQELVDLVSLDEVEPDVFKGTSFSIGTPNLYGGQALGQALAAANRTVGPDRGAHSLHAYFLLPGRHEDVRYEVTRIRDGRSFSTRRVVAKQQDQEIFELMVSFHAKERGVEHQFAMPTVAGPDGLDSNADRLERLLEQAPEGLRRRKIRLPGLDFRAVEPFDPLDPKPQVGPQSTWVRAVSALPDDPHLHRAVLAYASDHGLLMTAMLEHGLSILLGQVIPASLDHAMWFHHDFRMDDWLLYVTDSPSAAHGRGFCRGSFYTRDGQLVASTAQEGVLRIPSMKRA